MPTQLVHSYGVSHNFLKDTYCTKLEGIGRILEQQSHWDYEWYRTEELREFD
jgi:hypothetical protein